MVPQHEEKSSLALSHGRIVADPWLRHRDGAILVVAGSRVEVTKAVFRKKRVEGEIANSLFPASQH